jgi:hypothetical protein
MLAADGDDIVRVDLQGIWMPNDNRYIRDLALDLGDDKVPINPGRAACSTSARTARIRARTPTQSQPNPRAIVPNIPAASAM